MADIVIRLHRADKALYWSTSVMVDTLVAYDSSSDGRITANAVKAFELAIRELQTFRKNQKTLVDFFATG